MIGRNTKDNVDGNDKNEFSGAEIWKKLLVHFPLLPQMQNVQRSGLQQLRCLRVSGSV